MINGYDGEGMSLQAGEQAVILAVETHPKQPGMYRLAVRLPDKSGEKLLTVHEDTLVSMRLLKGRRLTHEEWEELLKEEALEEAYRAALAILERKARTVRELTEAMKRKGFSQDAIAGSIRRLKQRRLLDDAAYARRFAEQRVAMQRKGSRLVRQELLQRGISREEADQALQALDSGVEQETALALARKKWPGIKGEPREKRMKLIAFLVRRGFPGSVAKAAADQAASEAADTD
jgi:regulatory protein